MSMRDQMSIRTHIASSQDVRPAMPKPIPVVYNSSNSSMQSPPASSPPKREVKLSANDFIFGKLIGEGSFSMVYLAKEVNSEKEYAIKVCEKKLIVKEKKEASIMRERKVLYMLNCNPSPFFVKLSCTFQDIHRLYFALSYAKCGELLPYIKKVGSFDEACTKFYAAEILLALEHLHKLGIIHRDLKPENILLNKDMHIQITDFGSAKILHQENGANKPEGPSRKNSFVGTAEYVSPELLTDKCASKSSDLWALGCIIYQMTSGLPPFLAANEYLIFQKIMKLDYEFPDGFNPRAKDLVKKLLVLDPTERLGYTDTDGYSSIKSHEFFSGTKWSTLHEQTPPPIHPYLPGTSANEELHSNYIVPAHLEPGLDDKQMTRLLGLELHDDEEEVTVKPEESKTRLRKSSVLEITPSELSRRLEEQALSNTWHRFVKGKLILKQGLVDKRKGLFARRRMLLLTTGPRLFYVDPINLVLKGEIPWSVELRPETKNFKTFFVHTPNRTYYLEDPEGYALEWCRVINDVHKSTYSSSNNT